jgi:hypothetical protein
MTGGHTAVGFAFVEGVQVSEISGTNLAPVALATS